MENQTKEKRHLSPSQINMFLRCGAQYYFRYILGLKCPPKSAMTFGSSVDAGLNFNYSQKIQSRKDLKVNEVLDAYSTAFDLGKSETEWEKEEDPAEIKDTGIVLLKKYQDEIAPTIQPASVQEQLAIPFDDFDYDLLGYIDLIDEKGVIIDNKTSGKSPAKDKDGDGYKISADHDIQLSTYALGYRIKYGKPEKGLRVDYLIKTKEPKFIQVPLKKKNEDLNFLLRLIGYVADGIKKEVFIPNRLGMLCNERWCGYYHKCMKEF